MRALLSVSDKTGLGEFAAGLAAAGIELVSTGGTAEDLRGRGLAIASVSDLTGFPEILDGRVKTLHPAIHGGILARREAAHEKTLAEHGIGRFDLVIVNLYPFRSWASRRDVSDAEVVEQIDIGGPALLRAAAKNHAAVTVVVDPTDYRRVLDAIVADGSVGPDERRRLARKAFAHTAAYDAAIVDYFDREAGEVLPPTLHFALDRVETLRYGENPHQAGGLYVSAGVDDHAIWNRVVQHKGQSLSYLNIFDAEAAWQLVHEFEAPAAAIVKHANPCGFALGPAIDVAYRRAFEGDPKSAFGGVVACNRPVDRSTAEAVMGNAKCDVLIAPRYDDGALEALSAKRRNMRVLEAPPPRAGGLQVRAIGGGALVQEPDRLRRDRSKWTVVAGSEPNDGQWRDLEVAWTVCARTTSNAIVFAHRAQAVGIGAGQQSRVDAVQIAANKAGGRAAGGACASDAFFPFRDGLDAAAAAGVSTVIQPGGSIRDDEVIAAAEEHGITMIFTGRRHFRH